MSLLDDSLTRQLKSLYPERFKEVLLPVAESTDKINKKTHLIFTKGTSDKEYIVELIEVADNVGKYIVNFHFGRRGRQLKSGTKCAPVSWSSAVGIFDDLVKEKKDKGYWEV